MEVSNNYQTHIYTQSTNQNDVSSSTNNSLVSKHDEVPTQTETKEKKGRFLTYLEKHKTFEDFSEKDIKLFRSILMDDIVTLEEYTVMSYEKIGTFHEFMTLPKEHDLNLDKLPIYFTSPKIMYLNGARSYSKDEDFNKALFNTYKNISNDDVATLSWELFINIQQVVNNIDVDISYMRGQDFRKIKKEKDDYEHHIDFKKVLETIIQKASNYLNDSNTHREEGKLIRTKRIFSTLLDNYNQRKNESK